MQLEGSTRQFPLSELIALIDERSMTGMLEIGAPEVLGRIFCRAGQLYHAEAGDATGFDALRRLIQADAPFHFVLGARHNGETLWPDTRSLIGHIRQQELLHRRMSCYIPTLESIPTLRATSGDAAVRLSPTIWPALALIDGQRSVATIAAQLGHEPFEVGMLIGQLVAHGLAAIDSSQLTAQSSAEQPASDKAPDPIEYIGENTTSVAPSSSSGFFERLLTGRPVEQPVPKLRRWRMRLPILIVL